MNILCEPINITQTRKYKYAVKRNNYKKYKYANWNWIDIFKEIDDPDTGTMKYISIKYNVNYNTLRHKYEKWKKSGNSMITDNR
jgi:hypothetical protein